MSSAHATTEAPGALDPHLVEEHKKYFTFFNLAIALIFITGAELLIVYIPINPIVIYASLVVLSIIKFAGVVWWFMHLRWDQILCTILFLIGLILASGTVTALLLLFETAPGGVPAG